MSPAPLSRHEEEEDEFLDACQDIRIQRTNSLPKNNRHDDKEEEVAQRGWWLLRRRILLSPRFDLILQGALLLTVLIDAGCLLLLRRDAGAGLVRAPTEHYVKLGAACAEFLLAGLLSWAGRARRQMALAAVLAAAAVAGLLVLAFPFIDAAPPAVELCGGIPIGPMSESPPDPNYPARTAALTLTVILTTLARVGIWAHGLTTLDDEQPQHGPYYFGILISIRLSLGLSGPSWLRPGSVRDDWWISHLCLCLLLLGIAALFAIVSKKAVPSVQPKKGDAGFMTVVLRIISNRVILLQTLAASCMHAALFGFIYYESEYVQARFHVETVRQDPRTSRFVSDIFRSLVVIFFVMIFRVRFSVRRSDGVKASTAARVGGVTAGVVAICFAVLAALQCGAGDIAGVQAGEYQQPECSHHCGCNSRMYGFSPVCGLDTQSTYFSPCHAGCSQYEDLNGFLLFQNCSCGVERATRGSCNVMQCRVPFAFYQVFYTITLATGAASLLMQGMVLIRAVRKEDKPMSLGLSFAVTALLAHVFGHLLYMLADKSICAFSEQGTCLLHQERMWWLAVASVVLTLLSAVASLAAARASANITVKVDS